LSFATKRKRIQKHIAKKINERRRHLIQATENREERESKAEKIQRA